LSRILRYLIPVVVLVGALVFFYPPARLFALAVAGRSPACPIVNAIKADENLRLQIRYNDEIIKASKLRYSKNGQDFAFGYKLDDQVYGQQRELAVHFITPEYPYGPEEIRMHSAGKDELRLILEPDDRALADLRLLIKTEKYTKRKQTTSLSATEEQILRSKATQNVEREKDLVERIRRAVGKAALVINAADVASTSQDAIIRVTDGFQDLIRRTYTAQPAWRLDLQRAAGRCVR